MRRTVSICAVGTVSALWMFSAATVQAKPYPDPMPAEGQVIAAFTPEHDVAELIVDRINAAKVEVLVQAYLFTNRKITAALIKAHRRGVNVEVVADREQTFNVSQSTVRELVQAKVPVWLDNRFAAAHSKVILFDGVHVLTGSFNFTQAAQSKNAENVLLTLNAPKLTARYKENYLRRKALATASQKSDFPEWVRR